MDESPRSPEAVYARRGVDEADLDAPVSQAVGAIAAGRSIVLTGGLGSRGSGLLVTRAESVDADLVRHYLRHTSGHLRVAMAPEHASILEPLCGGTPLSRHATLSVDARGPGDSTGISVTDRAATARLLADPALAVSEVRTPGHLFPVAVVRDGVVRAPYPEEAAVDLARMAGASPVALIAELLDEDGEVATRTEQEDFASEAGIPFISVGAVLRYRWRHESLVRRVGTANVPSKWGTFACFGYESVLDARSHLAMVMGELGGGDNVLARLHSECLTGDVFGSLRCDCGAQLAAAMSAVASEGRGVVVYSRGQEGRGIGLISKLKAYALQDRGMDTIDANVALGLPVDGRDYGVGSKILHDLGVRSLRLITNNPEKIRALVSLGLPVTQRVPSLSVPTVENASYLRAKHERMGHHVIAEELPAGRKAHPDD